MQNARSKLVEEICKRKEAATNVHQFAPRPQGFQCPNGGNIKSFCDSADPFCCNGNDPVAHLQYPSIYGDQIKQFVSDKLK